jgi:hypothetical protein
MGSRGSGGGSWQWTKERRSVVVSFEEARFCREKAGRPRVSEIRGDKRSESRISMQKQQIHTKGTKLEALP